MGFTERLQSRTTLEEAVELLPERLFIERLRQSALPPSTKRSRLHMVYPFSVEPDCHGVSCFPTSPDRQERSLKGVLL